MKLTDNFERDHLLAQERMGRLSAYYQWSLSHMGAALGRRVWDAGAGTGLIADALKDSTDFLFLTEYGQKNLDILRAAFQDDPQIVVAFCDLLKAKGESYQVHELDTVITLDVIEHLADDRYALKVFFDSLQPGGHVFIKTPAHQTLFCGIDEASLHYRRYTTGNLREKLRSVGFEVVFSRYMNAPGAAMYFLKGKVMKRRVNFSRTFSDEGLSLMNRMIPVIQGVERWIPPFFGLSVVALGRKPMA